MIVDALSLLGTAIVAWIVGLCMSNRSRRPDRRDIRLKIESKARLDNAVVLDVSGQHLRAFLERCPENRVSLYDDCCIHVKAELVPSSAVDSSGSRVC